MKNRDFTLNGLPVTVNFLSVAIRERISTAFKVYAESFKEDADNSEATAKYYKAICDNLLDFKGKPKPELAFYLDKEFQYELVDEIIADFLLRKANG